MSLEVVLLHPFSAKAIGLGEEDLYYSHSKPQELAIRHLQQNGYGVRIDYFTGRWFPYVKEISGLKKKFWSVTSPIFKNRHGWRKQHSIFHLKNQKKAAADVTIINMSGHGSPYCFKLGKLLKEQEKPYIAMIGGMNVSHSDPAATYFRNAAHILVHTEVQKKILHESPTFKDLDIRVMPLGIDTEKFKMIPKDNSEIQLLFVGRISRLKQIEYCLHTVALLKQQQPKPVKLVLIGPPSDEAYFLELQQLVETLGINNEIEFLGMVDQEHLVPYFQKASMLLLPSAHESFGMVIVEAMACGTPVAAIAGAGGPDEIITPGADGILAGSKEVFPKMVTEYFTYTVKTNFGENARRKVLEKFSIEATCKVMETSIKTVLK